MMRLQHLQLAVMMLTRLPAGRLVNAPRIGASAWAFPVVGGILGGLAAILLLCLLWLGIAPSLAAGLTIGALVLLTGGLHEDGLADVADGFGGGRDRARKLAIMRDSQIGTYGALALVLSIGLRWQGLVTVIVLTGPLTAAAAIIALAIASRAVMATALWMMPAARSDGMGHLAAGTSANQAFIAIAIGFAALIGLFGWGGFIIAVTLVLMLLGFAKIAMQQIGGQTGDVLGATQQLTEIAGWIMLSALI